MNGAVFVAQRSVAKAHILYRALDPGDADHVSHVVLVLQQNEKAIDDVFYQGLSPEADGQADNTGTGKQGAEVETERSQDHQRRNKQNNKYGHAVNDRSQGADLLAA